MDACFVFGDIDIRRGAIKAVTIALLACSLISAIIAI
jgi:hypothetical protein